MAKKKAAPPAATPAAENPANPAKPAKPAPVKTSWDPKTNRVIHHTDGD